MTETAGELMKRVKNETANVDPYNEDEVINVYMVMPAESVAVTHTTTELIRSTVYYAGDGTLGDNVANDTSGTTIYAGFFKAS